MLSLPLLVLIVLSCVCMAYGRRSRHALATQHPLSQFRSSFPSDAFGMLSSRDFWKDVEDVLTSASSAGFFPIDTREDKETYTIYCDLPGVDKKDISISVEKDELTIVALKKGLEDAGEDVLCRRSERPCGEMRRTVALPDNIVKEKIQAESKDGVLIVTIPKKEKVVHSVEIK